MSQQSSPFKRGVVRELDPANARAKVEFPDEEGASSFWLSVNSSLASGTGSRTYAMPELGSQVHCLVDWRGEDGVILGASYSKEDRPPAGDANHVAMKLTGGLELLYDKGAGTLNVKVPTAITLECGGTKLEMKPGSWKVTSADYEFV
jgi:phage baseplate assembly protein V